MITITDRDDEETVSQSSSYLKWVEDWELRQQELDRLAVELFLESKPAKKEN